MARMTALEASSSDEKFLGTREGGMLGAGPERSYIDTSDEDPYGDSPESRTGMGPGRRPVTDRRGSLSSTSAFGAAMASGALRDHDHDTSDPDYSSPSNPNFSSPGDMQSGQSEQLPSFKDYYSHDEIQPGDKVATLWAYAPRAGDEFELERGDMLKVVGIWDDGWATGVRIRDRAEDWDKKESMGREGRDSGIGGRRVSDEAGGEVKAFPVSFTFLLVVETRREICEDHLLTFIVGLCLSA